LILGAEPSGNRLGSLAYSHDGGDHWRSFHPGGRCHLAAALAFGADRHLWLVSVGSVPGAKASRMSAARLRQIGATLLAGGSLRDEPPQLGLLRQPALLAIHPKQAEVTERLELPMAAHLITVHPDLKGTAWLAGRQGLMRLHAARVRTIPMATGPRGMVEPPLEVAGITLFRHPAKGAEQIFVALAGAEPAKRGIWLGERGAGAWHFTRVSEGTSSRFPDLPTGPVAVAADVGRVAAPYGRHGVWHSVALGAPGSWTALP
jgi:hypothetical protein